MWHVALHVQEPPRVPHIQGKASEAERLFREALEARERSAEPAAEAAAGSGSGSDEDDDWEKSE